MAKIGDFFDDSAKEASIESQLKIGVVLKLRVILSSGTKEKRIIVIGFNSDRSQLAFVTINSDVNRPYLRNRPILRALQVELKISGRDYLTYDSYVNCAEIYPRDYTATVNDIKNDFKIIIGNASDSDLSIIRTTLQGAGTISDYVKQTFSLL